MRPLGTKRRERTALSPKGLRNGIEAWRLEKTIRRRLGEEIVTGTEDGSGRHSTLRNDDGYCAAVRRLPREAPLLP
jgi:hypothetical protein